MAVGRVGHQAGWTFCYFGFWASISIPTYISWSSFSRPQDFKLLLLFFKQNRPSSSCFPWENSSRDSSIQSNQIPSSSNYTDTRRLAPVLPDPEKFNGQTIKLDTWKASILAKFLLMKQLLASQPHRLLCVFDAWIERAGNGTSAALNRST